MTSPNSDEHGPARVDDSAMLGSLERSRRDFLALVEQVRPDLHRYCARMTGSITDGEDVVQDTLAHAYYRLPELVEIPPLRPWLFRIAHNRAIDFHRRAAYRTTESLDDAADVADAFEREPEQQLMKGQAVNAAVSAFLALRPTQRACVILADVLEFTTEEMAEHLGLSIAATKAALHRGRVALRERIAEAGIVASAARPSAALLRYAALFNAHDWDGIRGMLADDVRLDLVSRRQAAGAADVGVYFSNYERAGYWRAQPALMEGREAVAFFDAVDAIRPRYFALIGFAAGQVRSIRDYRHVPYIGRDLELELFAA